MPSSIEASAPCLLNLMTTPSTRSPLLYLSAAACHGFSLSCFDRETHFAVFDVDYFYFDVVADLKEVARVVHEAPIDFRNMHEPLETLFELDKDAEVDHAGDLAHDHVAHLVVAMSSFFSLSSAPFSLKISLPSFGAAEIIDTVRLSADELAQLIEDFVFIAVDNARVVLGFEL